MLLKTGTNANSLSLLAERPCLMCGAKKESTTTFSILSLPPVPYLLRLSVALMCDLVSGFLNAHRPR